MRKIYLGILAMYLGILASHAQPVNKPQPVPATDSSSYEMRKLKVDEVNFVSGYYHQDGNHSAVTGGIGTENLTDFANTFDLQLSGYGASGRKNTYHFELGVDHYTSASSDKIDPTTISSASRADTRVYPSFGWTTTNEKTGNAFGLTASYSHEFDYQSLGAALNLTRLSHDKNTQFDLKLQAYLDTWKVIYPHELLPATTTITPVTHLTSASHGTGPNGETEYPTAPRNSFSGSFSLSQVINTRMQAAIIVEPSMQTGHLSTSYQRDYFTDGTEKYENLPDNRYKLPIALRLNYFLDDRFIIRTFYRFYTDSWGIQAHTAELELPVKLSSFVSVSPFYRYNTQQGTRYFAEYGKHSPTETYYTSDYDLSTQHSSFFGAGLRIVPQHGVLGWEHFNTLEIRYGHYIRSTDLRSDMITLALKFK